MRASEYLTFVSVVVASAKYTSTSSTSLWPSAHYIDANITDEMDNGDWSVDGQWSRLRPRAINFNAALIIEVAVFVDDMLVKHFEEVKLSEF